MSTQDRIVTSAVDPRGPGSGGGAPPTDWSLPLGSPFPSPENPRYVIAAEIDDGGMGIVYEARQGELGVVAIKVIKPRILGPTACERFLNEARAMAKVRSEPGIATIFDCDSYTDPATGVRAPFIVMEYIRGGRSITDYAAEKKLRLRARLGLMARVCEAVGAAHREGIIHRDLKPSNLLISASGQPKVIDFGLAHSRSPADQASGLPSERGGLFGTLEYMSPEQAARAFDPHTLSPASDVYSLGVILYELLVGRLPYERHPGKSVVRHEDGSVDYTEATRIIREDEPIRPRRLDAAIHPGLEAILLKALQKDPAERYPTATEMAEAIDRHLRSASRLDTLRAVPIVIVASLLAWFVGGAAIFRWTPINDWYQRAVAMVIPEVSRFQHVVIVTADDTSDPRALIPDAGPELGFAAGMRARPLWGAVCRQLADSGCRVVAMDMFIDSDAANPQDDDALLKGILALKSAGVEWIMAGGEWNEAIAPTARVVRESSPRLGAIWLRPGAAAWLVEAALERDGRVFPSMSLQAAGAWMHPGSRVDFSFAESDYSIRLRHSEDQGATWRQSPDRILMNRIVAGDAADVDDPPVDSVDLYAPEDKLALIYLPRFPSDEALSASRVDVSALPKLSAIEKLRLFKDKVVVLASRHPDFVGEFHAAPDGRTLTGSDGHALAIETMLQSKPPIRSVTQATEIALTGAGALIGALLCLRMPGRLGRATGAGVLAVGVIVAMSLIAISAGSYLVNPLIPSLSLLLALFMTEGATIGVALSRSFGSSPRA